MAQEAPAAIEGAAPSSRLARVGDVRVQAGGRVGYVPSRGFDTFASSDTLPAFAADATMTLLERGRFSLAGGLGWDIGGRASGVRGLKSSMTAWRVTAPFETRWHFSPWLYGFVKLAPGAQRVIAHVNDQTRDLEGAAWSFATDFALGASVAVPARASGRGRRVRFVMTPEVGYAVATRAAVQVDPGRSDSEVLGADAATNLGSLSLSGVYWRVSAGVTF